MIDQLINEAFLAQESLSSYLRPNGILPNPPMNELSVLLLRFAPFPTELAKYPVSGQTGMRLCFARSRPVTRPLPFLRLLNHPGPHGIQDDVPANFQEMTVFLDEDGFIPTLEQMTGPTVPFIEELCVNAV